MAFSPLVLYFQPMRSAFPDAQLTLCHLRAMRERCAKFSVALVKFGHKTYFLEVQEVTVDTWFQTGHELWPPG